MIEKKVYNVISTVMEVPEESISLESSADTIESWDSLKQMNLIMTLENEFSVEFSEEDVFTLLNCEIIIARINELTRESVA